MVFKVKSAAGLTSHVGVQEFSAEEGMCFMPYWLMRRLGINEGDVAQIENVSLPKGQFVKLQPHQLGFLDLANPKVV